MRGRYPRIVRRLIAVAGGPVLVLALGAPSARGGATLPSGASVAAGQALVAAPGESGLRITQSSQKALINWQSFSIGPGSNVTFQQPNSTAITLNRVVGTDVSTIKGDLFANGQVWLINGNGILFGRGSRIDVGGLIATTSDMRDADFLAGRYDFGIASRNPNAAVVNQGSIRAATGGSAVLSGARVVNDGVIEANLGKVVLAGANGFSVDFNGDNLIRFEIAAPVSETPRGANGEPAPALVSNSGTIAAQGGKILLTARAARSVVNNVINSTGIVEANSASMQNGEIVLDAGEGGTASVAGSLKAAGKNAGESGGAIALIADNVTVADGANLDASGDSGGGRVLIGGNLHGAGPEPNAQTVNVGEAVIAADAGANGKGGTVAIYSVGAANVAGSISARGGARSGDGGTVETSGHGLTVAESTHVDTSAPAGASGSWLLDPLNINVAQGELKSLPGGIDGLNTNPGVTDNISPGTIMVALATTNVRLEASNDINVLAPIIYDSANSLTFLAQRNVTLSASVQNAGPGAFLAVAGWDGVTGPGFILNTQGAYGNNGGSVLIGGGNAHGGVAVGSMGGTTTVAARHVALEAVNGYAQLGYNANANTSGSDLSSAQIASGGYLSQGSNSAKITVTASGDVTLAGGAGAAALAQIGNSAGTTGGTVLVTSGGNLTLASGASINADGNGDALVLAAAGGFINQAGAAALNVSGGGRWLIFLPDPTNNSAGGLSASPFYNRTFDFLTGSHAAIAANGNRFVYALAPTLNVTPDNQARTYGGANPALTATITGFLGGDALAGAVTGTPLLNTIATATSAIGDYAIVGALGSLASDFNYAFRFANGTLHIDPATLTYTAKTASRTYGSANPGLSGTLTGFVNGETQGSATSGTLAFTSPAIPASKVGTYAINGSGLTANNGNYNFAQAAGNATALTVDPAILTYAANAVRRTYGSANPAFSGAVTGFANGETQATATSGTLAFTSPATAANNVGLYAINGSGLTANNGNYNFVQAAGNAIALTIDPATLTYTANAVSRSYGTANPVFSGTVTGFVNGQTQASVTGGTLAFTSPATAASHVGSYAINGSGLTTTSNYSFAQGAGNATALTIDPATLTAGLTGSVTKTYDGTDTATLAPGNYTLAGVVLGDSVALNNPASGRYDDKDVGSGKQVSVSGLALSGTDADNYVLDSTQASAGVGVITTPPVDNGVLANLIGHPVSNAPVAAPAAAGPATMGAAGAGTSDATSATASGEEPAPTTAVANTVGNSLSGAPGSVPSWTNVLIQGLLRQFEPPPGAARPRAVPSVDQIYSSWGNEAFWQ